MEHSKDLQYRLVELDEERKILRQKRIKLMPWLILFPLSIAIVFGLLFFDIAAVLISTGFASFASILYYYFTVQTKFNKLKSALKNALLSEFMDNYHPDIQFSYKMEKQNVRKIIQKSNLITANIYKEEDVIEGKLKDADFYLSEINLKMKSGKTTHTVFKGLLFKIKIPGKSFPKSRIQSKSGLVNRLFSGYIQNEAYGFWYDTNENKKFNEEMQKLFPFIKYLIQHQGDIRISTNKDEIVIMLESKMKLFDDPKLSMGKSFINNEHYKHLGQQMNSLLYIVESFVNDLSHSEIENRLELKALEIVEMRNSNLK